MITVEEKLVTFSKMIIDKEQRARDKKLEEVRMKNKEILESHRNEVIKKGQRLIDKRIKEGKERKNEIISKVNIDMKNKILEKKRDLMDTLISDVINEIRTFTKSSMYREYLLNIIDDILNTLKDEDKLIIYLTHRDINKYHDDIEELISKSVFNKEDVSFEKTEEDIIGGVVVVSGDKRVRLDSSLTTKIKDSRDLIGQLLYSALKEGEDNG